jgi:hypothetical protein
VLVPISAFVDASFISKGDRPFPAPVILAIAILVSQIVFSFSYSLDNEQGLLLAISVQIIAVARTASDRVRTMRTRPLRAEFPIYPHGRWN